MKKINSIKLNLIKGATYAIWGAIAAGITAAIRGGAPLSEAVIIGVSFGIAAALKNYVKHKFGINLDFISLTKH